MEWSDLPFIPETDSSEALAMNTEPAVNRPSNAAIVQDIKAIIHGDGGRRFELLSWKETVLVMSWLVLDILV